MKGKFSICRVRSVQSHAGPGDPSAVFMGGQWREVDEILDRWYEGAMDPQEQLMLYFKVRAGDAYFLMRYLPHFQRWQGLEVSEP